MSDELGADFPPDEFGNFAVELRVDCGIVLPLLKRRAEFTERKALAVERNAFARLRPSWTVISCGSSPGGRASVPGGGS